VVRPAKTAALWAWRRAEQYQATGEVECLQREATDVNTVPLADQESPLGCVPGLKRLLINGGVQMRNGRGKAASAEPFLATPHGSNDAYAAIRSVDPDLYRGLEQLVVESILKRERFQREATPRRFGEQG
jgi:hypothetical protein